LSCVSLKCTLFSFFRRDTAKNAIFAPLYEKSDFIMAKVKGSVVVNRERCKGCDLCVAACPSDVLELHPREVNDKGYHYVYMKQPDACIGCANCGVVCPDGCLTVYKVKIG
jgi:2-oxoglutarate ferredoxin oxidoreductase subunit delta